MPYLCIFEEVFSLLGTRTVGGCGLKKIISNNQVKFSAKTIKAKFIVCYFWLTRVVTFGVLLYRNQ